MSSPKNKMGPAAFEGPIAYAPRSDDVNSERTTTFKLYHIHYISAARRRLRLPCAET
jgi:hypothetical protein